MAASSRCEADGRLRSRRTRPAHMSASATRTRTTALRPKRPRRANGHRRQRHRRATAPSTRQGRARRRASRRRGRRRTSRHPWRVAAPRATPGQAAARNRRARAGNGSRSASAAPQSKGCIDAICASTPSKAVMPMRPSTAMLFRSAGRGVAVHDGARGGGRRGRGDRGSTGAKREEAPVSHAGLRTGTQAVASTTVLGGGLAKREAPGPYTWVGFIYSGYSGGMPGTRSHANRNLHVAEDASILLSISLLPRSGPGGGENDVT